eukprot:SAG31_NODE_1205_length_9395_cov_3.282272_3_plen_107_part_00
MPLHTYFDGKLSQICLHVVAGDVRVAVYMHRCKRTSKPQPNEQDDELVAYFWFHTCFESNSCIKSLGGVRGIEIGPHDIDIKLKGWEQGAKGSGDFRAIILFTNKR